SAVLLGTVAFASQFPIFLLAPIGGLIADRHNRHRIVIGTQAASMILASLLAWLTLAGRIQVWHIFVLSSLLGVVNAFDIPARQSFIVQMVGKQDLMNAIALNSSMFNGARIVGPAIAGILVASIGEGWCFFGNAVSYIAVIAGLLMMHVPPRRTAGTSESPLAHLMEGFRYARHTRPIRSLLLLLGLVSIVGMPFAVLMPIFADRILHGGARGLGILMGATGVGALIGALTLATKKGVKGLPVWVLRASCGFGVTLILFAASRNFLLSVVLLVPVGASMITQMAVSNTLIQSMVPDQLRGRVMSLHSMMFMGMAPFGAFFAGVVAHKIGAPWTVALGGIGCLIGAAVFGSQLTVLRAETRELILAQQMAGGTPAQAVALTPATDDDRAD
ncbi:MAG TPA: MFS transporter, partial [Armatimonadota bacterium]|nr:MFS transporter [Armatimonadota bacterium]